MLISEKKADSSSEMLNLSKLLREVSKPMNIKLIRILHGKRLRYSELFVASKIKKGSSAMFAYYIKHLKAVNIITVEKRTEQYFLTFRGLKVYELLQCAEKIANIDIANIHNTMTRCQIELTHNESWLRPLIQKEIKQAVRELRK